MYDTLYVSLYGDQDTIRYDTYQIVFKMTKIERTYYLEPHSYGENLLTCANLHMSKFAHVSKSNFAMRSYEIYVP